MNAEQKRRYSRHFILDGIGEAGQQRLLDGKVLIIGAGGLGSPCALYLAAAGIGTIGIMDGDIVSLSNLQRQVIHSTDDVGKPKVESAAEKMQRMNPDVKVVTYDTFLTADNASEVISDYDFILDCTDSFASKYLVNDACVMAGKPFCCGGVVKWGGQIMTHVPGTSCYRCIFPEPPAENDIETCATAGVLGPAVGIMGTIQASEAVKFLASPNSSKEGGLGLLTDSLLTFDARTMEFTRYEFGRNEACPLCGVSPSITKLTEYSFKPCKL